MLKIKNWSDDELNYLTENYASMRIQDIADHLGRAATSIPPIAKKLGLKKQIHKPWSEKENAYLMEHYIDMTSAQLAKKFGRTIPSVNAQRDRLGLVRNAPWSEDEVKFLQDNYESMTYEQIGKYLNRTTTAVDAKCFGLGLYKKEKPWENWEIDFLLKNYKEMPLAEISETLGRTVNAVRLKAGKYGMKKSPYRCNYNFFDVIDSEEKAYWLGFLMADGWIDYNASNNAGAIGVELQYGDIGHLRKFNKALDGNYKITDRWRKCTLSKSDKKHHNCVLRIYSTKMYLALRNLGFTENKSFEACIPNIPDNLKRHFIRGYFDGNGSISNRSVGNCYIKITTASKRFKDEFIKLLSDNNISVAEYETVTEYGTTVYDPYIDGKEINRLNFLHFIYDDATVYLDRKYKRAMKVFEHDINGTNNVSLAC